MTEALRNLIVELGLIQAASDAGKGIYDEIFRPSC